MINSSPSPSTFSTCDLNPSSTPSIQSISLRGLLSSTSLQPITNGVDAVDDYEASTFQGSRLGGLVSGHGRPMNRAELERVIDDALALISEDDFSPTTHPAIPSSVSLGAWGTKRASVLRTRLKSSLASSGEIRRVALSHVTTISP